MNKKLLLLLSVIRFSFAFAQSPEFRNQGEQENYNSVQFFKTEYASSLYLAYTGSVSVSDNGTLKFGNKTAVVWGSIPELLDIFKQRIFYPQLLIGDAPNNPIKTKAELKSLSNRELFEYNLSRNDSLKISSFEELDFVDHLPTQRRFRFWFHRQGFANPQAYFMELTNEAATERTDLRTFIKGSKLTFLKGPWIVI